VVTRELLIFAAILAALVYWSACFGSEKDWIKDRCRQEGYADIEITNVKGEEFDCPAGSSPKFLIKAVSPDAEHVRIGACRFGLKSYNLVYAGQ
jgi:hypothetical protein